MSMQRGRLRYYEAEGYHWRYRAYLTGATDSAYYATNGEGDGLFLINQPAGTIKQLVGNGQFSARTLDQFKRLLRAYRVSLEPA